MKTHITVRRASFSSMQQEESQNIIFTKRRHYVTHTVCVHFYKVQRTSRWGGHMKISVPSTQFCGKSKSAHNTKFHFKNLLKEKKRQNQAISGLGLPNEIQYGQLYLKIRSKYF
jgi:hypothetical protein